MFMLSTRNLSIVLLTFAWLIAADSGLAVSQLDFCRNSSRVELGSTWNDGYQEGDIRFLELEIPRTGVLMVEVMALGDGAPAPRLTILGRGCTEPGTADDFQIVNQGSTYQIIAVAAAGDYSFLLTSQDPQQPLGEVELAIDFTATEVVTSEVLVAQAPGERTISARRTEFFIDRFDSKSEEDVVDPHPDSTAPLFSLVAFHTRPGDKSEEDVVDPHPDAQCWLKSEEDVVDPHPDAQCWLKSEEDVVDPHPDADSLIVGRSELVARSIVFANAGKSAVEGRAGAVVSEGGSSLARWLAGRR